MNAVHEFCASALRSAGGWGGALQSSEGLRLVRFNMTDNISIAITSADTVGNLTPLTGTSDDLDPLMMRMMIIIVIIIIIEDIME